MKVNNGSGTNPKRDEWETPSDLYENLLNQYHFDLDCCAVRDNSKCIDWSNDFLSLSKTNNLFCWMNPPFSKAWKIFEHFFKVVKKGVAIYRCDNLETGIWQKIIFPNCDWIFIPKYRINYEGLDGMGSRFPSALIGVGVDPPKYIDGICLKNLTVG